MLWHEYSDQSVLAVYILDQFTARFKVEGTNLLRIDLSLTLPKEEAEKLAVALHLPKCLVVKHWSEQNITYRIHTQNMLKPDITRSKAGSFALFSIALLPSTTLEPVDA